MASQLGVARTSVVAAYEHLLAEGYIESRRGSGTFISGELDGLASRPADAARGQAQRSRSSARAFTDFERSAAQSEPRPFNTGRTLIDARTAETWRHADPSRRALARRQRTSATPIRPA